MRKVEDVVEYGIKYLVLCNTDHPDDSCVGTIVERSRFDDDSPYRMVQINSRDDGPDFAQRQYFYSFELLKLDDQNKLIKALYYAED